MNYFLGQARKYWVELKCRQSQGHLAIALKRFGDVETPVAIMKSIKEYSVRSEELGMFWRDTELSWWWYWAPIETQALMIEAFDEVMGDAGCETGDAGYGMRDAGWGMRVVVFDDIHPVTELATTLGTIPYEILTGISRRVKRIYFYE